MKKKCCAVVCIAALVMSNTGNYILYNTYAEENNAENSTVSTNENAVYSDEVSGYEIHRYSSVAEEWEMIGDIASGENVSFTDKNLSSGTAYLYKVKPYKFIDGIKTIISEKCVTLRNVNQPKNVNVKGYVSGKSLTLKWTKTNCSGYRIYIFKDEQWKPFKYVSKNKTSYKFSKLYKQRYSFKVVPVVKTSNGNVYKSSNNSVVKVNMKTKKAITYKPETENKTFIPTRISIRIKNGNISLSNEDVQFNLDKGYSNTAMIRIAPVINAAYYEILLKKDDTWDSLGRFDDSVKISLIDYLAEPLEPSTDYSICVKAKKEDGTIINKAYRNFTTTAATLFRVNPKIDCYNDEDLSTKIGTLKTNGLYTGQYIGGGVVCLDCFDYKKNASRVTNNHVYIKASDCKMISSQSMNPGSPLNQYQASINAKDGINSCGSAALACMLNYAGEEDFTARSLRSHKYSNEYMSDLTNKANKYSYTLSWNSTANISNKISGYLKSGKSVLVLINYKNTSIVPYSAYGHYVVICGSDKNNYYIADSLYHSVDKSKYEYMPNHYFSQGLRSVSKTTVHKSIAKTGYTNILGILEDY